MWYYVQSGCCAHGLERVPSDAPCTFPTGSWIFPLCTLHHMWVSSLVHVNSSTLLSMGSCSLGLTNNCFKVLCWACPGGVPSVVLPLVLLSLWLVSSCWVLPFSQLLVINLLWTLSKVIVGYLHLDRASLRCYISTFKSSSRVQTVFALWVRVPMTLYLAAILWWLSHCSTGEYGWVFCTQKLIGNYLPQIWLRCKGME